VAIERTGAPSWIPLTREHDEYLNQILAYWEHSTGKIERYRSQFKRWEYEFARRGNQNYEMVLKTYSEGDLKYAAPDKGLFQVNQIQHRVAPKVAGGQPEFQVQEGGPREHWVCDGKSIFQFDYNNKQLVQRTLPPEMQGRRISEGPLPFLFGAEAEKIKQRFWIRVITPADVKNEYHLEAIPKTREDAQNFRAMHIVISEADFLPKAMVLFHRNNAKTTYLFENRETNWNVTLNLLNVFHREFFEPALPERGWKKVVEPLQPSPPPGEPGITTRPNLGTERQAQGPRAGGATPR
jgi:TIGR03009 family protein